jgi:hypothetical protein
MRLRSTEENIISFNKKLHWSDALEQDIEYQSNDDLLRLTLIYHGVLKMQPACRNFCKAKGRIIKNCSFRLSRNAGSNLCLL